MLTILLTILQPLTALALPVRQERLDNGLTLLMLERPNAPIVSARLAFRVGSVNETSGMTGAAHILEHMMFKGTTSIGTTNYEAEKAFMAQIDEVAEKLDAERALGDTADASRVEDLKQQIRKLQEEQRGYIQSEALWGMYTSAGGKGLNAFTSYDYTCYKVDLPANRLELWAWLESDRLADPILREFYTERDVVMEERISRYDDDPEGALRTLLESLAFVAHPYGRPIIGWPSDISFLKREEIEGVFRSFYAPNNAVIVLVGGFDSDEALALVKKYFGAIPAQPPPPAVRTQEPEQRGERRGTLEFDAQPALLIGWRQPGIDHPDSTALDALSTLLTDGRTSRLYQRLVLDEQLTTDVSSYSSSRRYPGLFVLSAKPQPPHTCRDLEVAIYQELERLALEPPSPEEMQRVKNQFETDWYRDLEANSGMADALAFYESISNWRYLEELPARYAALEPADIVAAAERYLKPSNRTVVELVPTKQGQEQGDEQAMTERKPLTVAAVSFLVKSTSLECQQKFHQMFQ